MLEAILQRHNNDMLMGESRLMVVAQRMLVEASRYKSISTRMELWSSTISVTSITVNGLVVPR
jgi:hypothetical protein